MCHCTHIYRRVFPKGHLTCSPVLQELHSELKQLLWSASVHSDWQCSWQLKKKEKKKKKKRRRKQFIHVLGTRVRFFCLADHACHFSIFKMFYFPAFIPLNVLTTNKKIQLSPCWPRMAHFITQYSTNIGLREILKSFHGLQNLNGKRRNE